MPLYLVRHCPKGWKNGRKPVDTVGAQFDPPIAQGPLPETLAALQGVEFDAIYCSPFLRTRQTLDALGVTASGIAYPVALREFLGNHRRQRHFELDPETVRLLGGQSKANRLARESIVKLKERVRTFAAALPTDQHILIVSHGIVLSELCGREVKEGGLVVV